MRLQLYSSFLIGLCCSLIKACNGFSAHTVATSRRQGWISNRQLCRQSEGKTRTAQRLMKLSVETDMEIGVWMAAFSFSHIGMSAIREDLIDICGKSVKLLGLVGRKGWDMPEAWPGDEAGQSIWPTEKIAGRQVYRMVYSLISFLTLGSALSAYLHALELDPPIIGASGHDIFFLIATVSWAVSIASLFNPSPLSLVPSYEQDTGRTSSMTLQRNDARKLQPVGLTKVTRHPLILPVAPWGLATAECMGGGLRELFFFCGLSAYAVAGCLAQDLRVARREGSVGTVFNPGETMQGFFESTSFLPFGAVLDGRQSLSEVIEEVPWFGLALGLVAGFLIQTALTDWLFVQSAA